MRRKRSLRGFAVTRAEHALTAKTENSGAVPLFRESIRKAARVDCLEADLAYASGRERLGEARAHAREAQMAPKEAIDFASEMAADTAIRKCIVGANNLSTSYRGRGYSGLSGRRRRSR